MKPDVAWIGLGTMGAAMARHALDAGFPLTVHNRTPDRTRPLAGAGASVAATPRDAAAAAEIVIVMLSSPQALESVLEGDHGILRGLRPGALLVDMATDGVAPARRAAERAGRAGAAFVDAPVLGSRIPAERGRLIVMAGGEARDVDRLRPVLDTFSKAVHHTGPVGSGQAMKLVTNFMLAHMLTGLAGAVSFARATGLSDSQLVDILEEGIGSDYFGVKGRQMIEGDFAPHFTLDLARKDVGLIRGALDEAGLPIGTIPVIQEIFEEAARRGWGGEDGAALVKLWSRE